MPVLSIFYTTSLEGHAIKHETEWVSPTGWTAEESLDSFKLRHPTANITGILDITGALEREEGSSSREARKMGQGAPWPA